MNLEAAGIPTVLLATTAFQALAAEMAATLGLPDMRIVAVDHPLGGTDEAAVIARAEAAVEPTLGLLTGRP